VQSVRAVQWAAKTQVSEHTRQDLLEYLTKDTPKDQRWISMTERSASFKRNDLHCIEPPSIRQTESSSAESVGLMGRVVSSSHLVCRSQHASARHTYAKHHRPQFRRVSFDIRRTDSPQKDCPCMHKSLPSEITSIALVYPGLVDDQGTCG
jgi:hypothetical protein